MHLWPSTRLRDSFKENYLKKLQFNFERIKTEKRHSSSEDATSTSKLLNDDTHEDDRAGACCVFCSDLAMVFSICFCCGGCE